MPIRADLRHFYRGPAWRATRERILARADNKCERCGAPNHKVVLRQYGWWTEPTVPASVWATNGRFRYEPGTVHEIDGAVIQTIPQCQFISLPWKHAGKDESAAQRTVCFPNTRQHRWVYIVLTIAHLNHMSGDDRDENLQAMCQWCHLNYDERFHKQTRSVRKDAARPLLAEASL